MLLQVDMAMLVKSWSYQSQRAALRQTCRDCRPTLAAVADTIGACSRLTSWKPALALLEAVQDSCNSSDSARLLRREVSRGWLAVESPSVLSI